MMDSWGTDHCKQTKASEVLCYLWHGKCLVETEGEVTRHGNARHEPTHKHQDL